MRADKIDIDALRQIEKEKGLDFHTVVEAFETAMASAYKRAPSFNADEARVHVDRGTGDIVWTGATSPAEMAADLERILAEES